MRVQAWFAAMAAAFFAAGALAAADPSHLIDDSGAIRTLTVKPLYVCDTLLFCRFTTVDVQTEDWYDRTRTLHKDGCTARWDYRGIDVQKMTTLRWKINPLDKEEYYFDASVGVMLYAADANDRKLDLDQEGYVTGSDTFKWYDFNRRPRLGDLTETEPTKRGIRFDFRVYRVRGAGGAAGPELCGSFDPVIFNRG